MSAGTLLLSLALGAAAGWSWWAWWGPGPDGQVYELQSGGYVWVPEPAEAGYSQISSATPQFVAIGLLLGLMSGLIAGFVFRRLEMVGLVTLIVASVLGAVAMAQVGMSMSPPDPQLLAGKDTLGDTLPGALDLPGIPPYLGWPMGAVLGYLTVLLIVPERSAPTLQQSTVPSQPA